MMRKSAYMLPLLMVIILIGVIAMPVWAQDTGDGGRAMPRVTATPAAESTAEATAVRQPIRAEVQVESAFVRVLPSESAAPSASVFEDEILEIIGRNMDGLWFEVRRPNRVNNLGWIFNEMLDWDFDPTLLPLTDFTTGLIGTETLASDPGWAITMLDNGNLRRIPIVDRSPTLGVVPIFATVPVIYRNQDGTWFYVNYLGIEGWVSDYSVRQVANPLAIPIAPGLPPLPTINIEIIPREVQLEQLNRLRDYTTIRRDFADMLANFWFYVYQGQVMPCEPPPFVVDYLYNARDVQELPELQRYVPRLVDANFYLNSSIELLTVCGAFDPEVVGRARNNAINARGIYQATLGALDNLERFGIPQS